LDEKLVLYLLLREKREIQRKKLPINTKTENNIRPVLIESYTALRVIASVVLGAGFAERANRYSAMSHEFSASGGAVSQQPAA
jgi:hypothetical protein